MEAKIVCSSQQSQTAEEKILAVPFRLPRCVKSKSPMANKLLLMKPTGLVATIWCALASVAFAVEPTPHSEPLLAPSYQLVFSDDFSTDPNSNGNWTVFRAQNDPT